MNMHQVYPHLGVPLRHGRGGYQRCDMPLPMLKHITDVTMP